MVKAVRIEAAGGPEVIRITDVDLPPPSDGEVTMRNTAVGLNYIDIYHRSGVYPVSFPSGLGVEAAGVVEAVGSNVQGFAAGDRVCTFGPELGAYAQARNVSASTLFKLPDSVDDETAAAIMLKGCTVEALVERCAKVEAGQHVLVHAAAGGVGLLLTQWLKHVGANVIGTASSEAKAEEARAAGADHVLLAGDEDLAQQVITLSDGKGVHTSFDGVGAETWETSLQATRPMGLIVSFGNASGSIENVAIAELANAGSLFVTRPGVFHYYRETADRAAGCRRLFEMIENGVLNVSINQRYDLADAGQAHRDLAARKTTGSTLLIP